MLEENLITMESTMKFNSVMDNNCLYRYSLTRIWDVSLPKMTYIMLNPSVADHLKGDPTLNKCMNFSIENGYGSIEIVNLFAFRATDPEKLRETENPIGKENDRFILKAVKDAKTIVLAWGGNSGRYMNRDNQVLELIYQYRNKIKCFEDFTKNKKPKHPLSLRNGFILIDYPFKIRSKKLISLNQVLKEQDGTQINKWENLNHLELNRYAKEIATERLTSHGYKINNKNNDLLCKAPNDIEKIIQVRSIRSSTNYVLLPKSRFDVNQENLFLLLLIFSKGEGPELYLIPSNVFKKPNDLFKDRDHYEIPEYGMNVSRRNMHLLKPFLFEKMVEFLI
jgi:hypothetical protein